MIANVPVRVTVPVMVPVSWATALPAVTNSSPSAAQNGRIAWSRADECRRIPRVLVAVNAGRGCAGGAVQERVKRECVEGSARREG